MIPNPLNHTVSSQISKRSQINTRWQTIKSKINEKGEYSKITSYVCTESKHYKIKWNVHFHRQTKQVHTIDIWWNISQFFEIFTYQSTGSEVLIRWIEFVDWFASNKPNFVPNNSTQYCWVLLNSKKSLKCKMLTWMLLEDDETWPHSCKYLTPPSVLAKILPETTVRA